MDDEFARHKKAYDNQEKIKEALELLDEWLGIYKYELNSFVTSDQPDKVEVTQRSIDRLEKIKKTLS